MVCDADRVHDGDRLSVLRWQLDLAWGLGSQVHLPALDDVACLWAPTPDALTVRRDAAGTWRADWFEDGSDGPRTVTIGWLTWHVQWWWGGLLARARGATPTPRDEVAWPGSADGVRAELGRLHDAWAGVLDGLTDADLDRPFAFPWPEPRPFVYAVAWANAELMKNVAEIGVIRHQLLAPPAGG